MKFTPAQVRNAITAHATVFFDADLQPVTPIEGQWFCEFDVYDRACGYECLRDEALVEYTGNGLVIEEGEDAEERRPGGLVLILQAGY